MFLSSMPEPTILLARLVAAVAPVAHGTWSPDPADETAFAPQRTVLFQEADNDLWMYGKVKPTPSEIYVGEVRFESSTRAASVRLGAVWYAVAEKIAEHARDEHDVGLIALDTGVFAYHPTERDFANDDRLTAVVRTVYHTGKTLKRMIEAEAQRIFDREYR